MAHHSGHGVGLLAWEEPCLYVPSWGGMRLEGNYLITATGFDRLDRFPSTLVAVAG
jgi:Xaa-Pro aminopeptidase